MKDIFPIPVAILAGGLATRCGITRFPGLIAETFGLLMRHESDGHSHAGSAGGETRPGAAGVPGIPRPVFLVHAARRGNRGRGNPLSLRAAARDGGRRGFQIAAELCR